MERRQRVTGVQMVLARHAWRVFSAPEPVGIELLLKRDISALPFLEGRCAAIWRSSRRSATACRAPRRRS